MLQTYFSSDLSEVRQFCKRSTQQPQVPLVFEKNLKAVKDKVFWEDAFRNANAIVALEGGVLTPEVAAIQNAITNGELSLDDGVATLTRIVVSRSANACV